MALIGRLSIWETLSIKVPAFAWKKMPREHFGLLQKEGWFSCANRPLSCTRSGTASSAAESGPFAKVRTARFGPGQNSASPELTGVEISVLSNSPDEPLVCRLAASGQNAAGVFGLQKTILACLRA